MRRTRLFLRALAITFGVILSSGRLEAGASPRATWPSTQDFAAARSAAANTYELVEAEHEGRRVVVLAHRRGAEWLVDHVFGEVPELRGCHERACKWPASLKHAAPTVAARELPERYRERIAYARALLGFEPPLRVREESSFSFAEVPGEVYEWFRDGPDAPPDAPALDHLLEPLRRFYPLGSCSVDLSPQRAALLRALAAAQAGRTGWAVQAWAEAVGYWSSERLVRSSYGAKNPEGHQRVLDLVGVDARKLFLGLVLDVPGHSPAFSLGDLARLLNDFDPELTDELRAMAADPELDSWNRARSYVLYSSRWVRFVGLGSDDDASSDEALFEDLPPSARALVRHWESHD